MASGRWLDAYGEKREFTSCPSDIGSYFTKERVGGMEMSVIRAGTCSVPSGKMIVRDPMSYLGDPREKPYLEECPKGEFAAEIAAVFGPDGKDMYAACRVLFSEEPAVSFYEALVGYEDIYRMAPGEYFGFETESGLACICDEEAHQAFCEWMDVMFEDDPDFELHSDVLEQAFMDSRDAHPEHQGPSGDWIRWTVPGTELSAIIVQAGNGAGAYPVYWGYDARGNICQIAAQFLDLESGDERFRGRRFLSQGDDSSSEGVRFSVSAPVPVHGNEASRPDTRTNVLGSWRIGKRDFYTTVPVILSEPENPARRQVKGFRHVARRAGCWCTDDTSARPVCHRYISWNSSTISWAIPMTRAMSWQAFRPWSSSLAIFSPPTSLRVLA